MTSTPGQVLTDIIAAVADIVLNTEANRDRRVDRKAFVQENRRNLLRLVAGSHDVRVSLATRFGAVATAHRLLEELLDADAATSDRAAGILGEDRSALLPRHQATSPTPSGEASSADRGDAATEKTIVRLRRDNALMRAKRDEANGRLDNARKEIADWRRRHTSLAQDLDEATTESEGLRTELVAERERWQTLHNDPSRAAETLVGALRSAVGPAPETDLREQDRMATVTEELVTADHPKVTENLPEPVLLALKAAGIGISEFLGIVEAIASPPVTAPLLLDTHEREVTVTPLGGGTEIGGSCILVEAGQARLLVDCGSRPGQPLSRCAPPHLEAALHEHLDAVVITHAHNDHAGYVPALVAQYPHLRILCTAETAALLPTMWNDSVKVFERTITDALRRGDADALNEVAPYRSAQVKAAVQRLEVTPVGRVVEITDGVSAELFPAGHILGAAGVVVTAGPSRVTITGDVSHPSQDQASVGGISIPASARGCDLLLIESTYCRPGGRPRTLEVERFLATVYDTVNGDGRVLVPAFALGRAQEVVLTLRTAFPGMPILVDGLARSVSRIYEQQTVGRDNPLTIFGDGVQEVAPRERRELNASMRRGVIVATSGMMAPGSPAATWAEWILPDPRSALLISGYQDAESAGAELIRLAEQNSATFDLGGQRIDVRANVAKFALSAHADRKGLGQIVTEVGPRQTMLVHGLRSSQREFADHLRLRSFQVVPTGRAQIRSR
ncbi:hypothetical protein GCM10022223_43140 [Kineosporia mesophila]|uniref:Uncharacterized protein n=1 Tax=Kineosporia mesophila TaxID=566012 RepID=A0ABP6ZWR7_9ACTN|nr:MBL fold metallo-hydrolase [Kineosporia mesophila]MCD5353249.1 MBL fold metallo-hydrolase [Kineosporia mesophila]